MKGARQWLKLIKTDTGKNKRLEDTYRVEVQFVSWFLVLIHP